MSDRPKVSVIIATHNNAETISNCIESVWCRDFKAIEVIAVDVNSTDGTKDILSEIEAEDENVIFLADSMGSIGHAKNIGLDHARGDYIIFMEPGDDFHSNALEYMCNKLDEDTKYDMFVCDTDSFGDDSFGRTNEDRNSLIGEANRKDSRQREMESRLVRNWIFDSIILYRQEYLKENGLKHYDMPGYGSQDAAFRFLSLIKGKFFLSVEVIYDRRFDIEDSSITDTRSALDVSNEFRFLERELKEDKELWWKYRLVFWQAYYDRNMLFYEKLSDEARQVLSKRMQSDLREAIRRKEYSREHFDVLVRDEMEILLKSAADFDRVQKEKIKERENARDSALRREDRNAEILAENEKSGLEHGHKERLKEREEKLQASRLDRTWLLNEMARDMAPLRMLLGLNTKEMGDILGISESNYKSLESGKREISWDLFMALLTVFRYNGRTAPVTDVLGLYPEPLKMRVKKGISIYYG